jgi:hypothetical protein
MIGAEHLRPDAPAPAYSAALPPRTAPFSSQHSIDTAPLAVLLWQRCQSVQQTRLQVERSLDGFLAVYSRRGNAKLCGELGNG